MKITIIGPTYPFRGGISHYTTCLYRALTKNHEVQFISFSYQYPSWLFPGKADKDPSLDPLKPGHVEKLLHPFKPWTWFLAAKKVHSFRPGCVLFQWWHWFWFPSFFILMNQIKAKRKIPIVSICHNATHHEKEFPGSLVTRWMMNLATHILVHSHEEKNRLKQMNIKKSILVHPHPITLNLSDREEDHHDPLFCRRKLGLRKEDRVVLFFGFVRKYKGLDILIKAIAEVNKKCSVYLIIAGEFWKDKQSYKDLIQKLNIEDKIKIFDEYIRNESVSMFFNACDVVALPYRSVTGSGILPLAIAHGKPVIASKLGAIEDLIIHNKMGLLVNPEDESQFASSIQQYFECVDQKNMSNEISLLKDKLSWDHYIDKIIDIVVSTNNEQPAASNQ